MVIIVSFSILRIVVCLTYYGLALNSGDFGSNMYLSFLLQALMDLPASIIILLLLDRTGRKPLMVGSMMVGGLGCLLTVFTMIYAEGNHILYLQSVRMIIYYSFRVEKRK